MFKNFKMYDNQFLKDNPEIQEELIKILQRYAEALEGGAEWGPTSRTRSRRKNRLGHGSCWTAWSKHCPCECEAASYESSWMNNYLLPNYSCGKIKGCSQQVETCWNSSILSVSKKDLTAKRFVLDLRPLNAKCKHLAIHIGSVDANLINLHGSLLFSAFDMLNGFHTIPIAKADQQYFAFTTPAQGSWAFTHLPVSQSEWGYSDHYLRSLGVAFKGRVYTIPLLPMEYYSWEELPFTHYLLAKTQSFTNTRIEQDT